jgi:hypothetical protein
MKSKKDLTEQMERIAKNYPNSKLYNLAQYLVLTYNHNMSMTEINKILHKRYMASFDAEEKKMLLEEMLEHKYGKNEYIRLQKMGDYLDP